MAKSSRNRPAAAPPRDEAPSANAGEFPKMLYGPKGKQVTVKDPDAQLEQEQLGFVEHPDDVVEPKAKKKKKGEDDAVDEADGDPADE